MLPDYCMIDHKYYVDISELRGEMKQGDKVKFIAYNVDANRELKVTNVTSLEKDQWERGRDIEAESCVIG